MIDNFFKNKYAQAVLVFFVVLGIVYFYQSLTRPAYGPGIMMGDNMEEMHEEMEEIMDKVNPGGGEGDLGQEMEEVMRDAGATDELRDQMGDMMYGNMDNSDNSESVDYTGTHIMANGDVMLRTGEVVPDAVINEDGSVTMPDGTVLESVMDMRN